MNLRRYSFKDAYMYCEVDYQSRSCGKDVWFLFFTSYE